MPGLPRRRLTETRKQRVRESQLQFSLSRGMDRAEYDEMTGQQSWFVTMREREAQEPYCSIGIHRVPLDTGYDVGLVAEESHYIPGLAVEAVVGKWDGLNARIRKRLADMRYPKPVNQRLMVVEPVEMADDWDGYLSVAGYFAAESIAELYIVEEDVLAVVAPIPWHLKGRARGAHRARQVPVFESLGFEPFDSGTWVLTDWSAFWRGRAELCEKFDVNESYFCNSSDGWPRTRRELRATLS